MISFIKNLRNKILGSNFIISKINEDIQKENSSLICNMNNFIGMNSNIVTKQIENTIINNSNIATKQIESIIVNNVKEQIADHISFFSDRVSNELLAYLMKKEDKYVNGKNINIVLFIQHQTVWNSLKSVYLSMKNNEKINVSVVLLPFIHYDSSIVNTYNELKNFFIKENVPFINYNFYSLKEHKPHIVFVQNPYEETRPERFRIEEIHKYRIKICYVPYGLDVGGGIWNIQAQFNLPIHNLSWKIFVRSNKQKDMYGKYCDAGNSHITLTGHPKFDNKSLNISSDEQLIKKINGRKVILWVPHFSVGMPVTWSTYNIYHKAIIEEFVKRQDLFLYIRPHPLFFKAMLNHNIWEANDEILFRKKLLDSNNMALDESSNYLEAFSISNAIMADAGSFLLEYLPSLKPILYLNHPDGLGLYDEDLEELYYKANTNEDIVNFIDMVSKSNDPALEKRKVSISEYLYGLDGQVGNRIVEHIISAFNKEDFNTPIFIDDDNLQKQSTLFWENCANIFLAPAEYYKIKESILKEVCKSFNFSNNAIDIGCGNGTFTFILSKYFKKIQAFDLSYNMIDQAKEEQKNRNIDNIEFIHSELKDIKPFEKYELVSCMGVTSTISDDIKYLKLLESFKILSKKNGHLFLIDTLSLGKEQLISDDSGYVAKYRNILEYRYLIEKLGFTFIEDHTIKLLEERNLINSLFIFKNKRGNLK